jgi:hypothetical protein
MAFRRLASYPPSKYLGMVAGHFGELVDLVLRHFDRQAPAAVLRVTFDCQFFDVVKTNGSISAS